jgi:serine/threonine-protein kinase
MVTPAGTRSVAIKQLLHKGESAAATERMADEARLVFRLTHANVCQVIDFAASDEGTYIVMEHVDGCDLHTLLRRGPLEVPAAVHIAREVALALDYAHRRSDEHQRPLLLVHGDVKPSNILLSKEGEVKLADFGIARALGTHAPGNRIAGGTPGFVAPESSLRVDQRSDIFSLGITLYVALGGELHGGQPNLEAFAAATPAVGPELLTILERATAVAPDRRYTTASELEEALGLHLAHKFPSFRRSVIGQMVARSATVKAAMRPRELTLVSLTQPGASPTTQEGTDVPARTWATQRAGRRRRGRRRWLLASTLSCAAALGLAAWRGGAITPASTPPGTVVVPAAAPAGAPTAATTPGPSPPPSLTAPAPAAKPPADLSQVTTRQSSGHTRGSARQAHNAVKRANDAISGTLVESAKPVLGYLTVNAAPWGAVLVDGKKIAEQTPAYRLPIAVGPHRVTVYNPERRDQAPVRAVDVRAGEVSVVGFKW